MAREDLYERYDSWKGWDEGTFGRCDAITARYFCEELSEAGMGSGKQASLLEIGFGFGQFASWTRTKGYGYLGTERDPRLVALAQKNGFEAVQADVELPSYVHTRRFSHAVAFDVLEHLSIDEIVALLRSIFHCLEERGRFLARVPSGDSPFGRAIQHGDATHVTVIGSAMAAQLADAAGLVVVQARAPVLPIMGGGFLRGLRRAGLRLVRAVISKAVNMTYHDNRPTVISPNMVIVFERRRAAE